MSTTVVPAPAVQAKRPVRSDKPAIRKDEQNAVNQDEERAAQDDSEKQVASATEGRAPAAASETSLAGGFTFGAALAEAAATAGSLTAEAENADEVGFSQFGDDGGSTILLVGALALVGLGVLVLAGGGGNKAAAPVITNGDAARAVTTNEDTAVTFVVAATDANNDVLTFTASAPTKGTVTVGANGSLTYTPNANANGTDSFVVTVKDPGGLSDTQTINITITPVNDAPVITGGDAPRAITTNEDEAVTFTVAATDVDTGDVLTFTADGATKGTVTVGANGAITYTPNANANGTDSFVVTVKDAGGLTDTQTINVTITPVDDPVSFNADSTAVQATEDAVFNGSLTALIVDPDGDGVLTVQTQGAHGTVVVNANGTYTYTPVANYFGNDSFVVKIADAGSSDTITVNVTVANVNDAPSFGVEQQAFEIGAGATLEGTLQATDIDGDTLTYGVATDAMHGTLTVAANGTLLYTPDDGFIGEDTFTVKVSDGKGGEDTLAITVNVLEDIVTELSIDVPPSGAAVVFDAGDGEFRFTDDVTQRTDVIIKNFSADDVIVVTGANASDYNFGTQGSNDLRITFNDGTNFTQIIIEDVIQSGFVFDYDSAVAAIGIDNFITFA